MVPAKPKTVPTPRQGYLLVVPLKNPWGEKTDTGIIVSTAVNAAPGAWYQVVQTPPESLYAEGSFIYFDRGQAEPVVMAERTLGLVHESHIKLTMYRDSFKPEYESVQTAEFVQSIERSRQQAPQIVQPTPGLQIVRNEG